MHTQLLIAKYVSLVIMPHPYTLLFMETHIDQALLITSSMSIASPSFLRIDLVGGGKVHIMQSLSDERLSSLAMAFVKLLCLSPCRLFKSDTVYVMPANDRHASVQVQFGDRHDSMPIGQHHRKAHQPRLIRASPSTKVASFRFECRRSGRLEM